MAEDMGQEDVVGLVFWGLKLVATDCAVGGAKVARSQGWSRQPKAAETYVEFGYVETEQTHPLNGADPAKWVSIEGKTEDY